MKTIHIIYTHTGMTRLLLLLSVSCLSFTACTTEDQVFVNNTDSSVESREARVSFSLSLPFRMQTRALSESDEHAIHDVRVLVFKETGVEKTLCLVAAGSNIRSGSLAQKTFDATLPSGRYDIVVLANAGDIADKSGITLGDTKENVLRSLVKTGVGKWRESGIPMCGRADNLEISASPSAGHSYPVDMIRMLAKTDVEVGASAVADFTLVDVRLYNYSSQGALVPDPAAWPAGNIAVAPVEPAVAGGYGTVSAPLVFDAADGVTATGCRQIIYTCETPAGSDANMSGNTCLVIGGRYRGGATSYYRIDFIGEANGAPAYLPLLRNNYYLIKIVRVAGSGHPTPEAALQSPSVNMNTLVLYWTEQGLNNVVFDGKYMLGVSASRLTLPGDARTAAGADNRLTIMSTSPGGWEIEKITDAGGAAGTAPWLTLGRMSGAGGAPSDVFVMTEGNASPSDRAAYIYIRSGNLRYCTEVIQTGTPGFGIEVTDAATGLPAGVYDYTYQGGDSVKVNVSWTPSTLKATVYVTTIENGSGTLTERTELTSTPSRYGYAAGKVTSDRMIKIDFTVTDGVRTDVETLMIRYRNN